MPDLDIIHTALRLLAIKAVASSKPQPGCEAIREQPRK
jgi:hypothetical protein